ncbi:MAG: condensation domain-containing protein, partial [Streptosporangiaceae bacterium]
AGRRRRRPAMTTMRACEALDGVAEAPTAPAQQGLWLLHQLRPADTSNHVCYTLDWPGPVNAAGLGAALDDLVARHEALRTVFPAVDGAPRQVIAPRLHVPLGEADLDPDGPTAGEWAQQEARAPFDLASGPLLRATLLRRGGQPTLVLSVHHIIFDAWSVDVLVDELGALYLARQAGTDAGLAPLPAQYADFARWQQDRLTGPALDRQLGYWRARLAGGRGPLPLPTDGPRGRAGAGAGAGAGATHQFVFPGSLREAMADLGRRRGASMFMVVLAGFQLLLHRCTGREDIAVGTAVTMRDRPEFEGLIGYCLNTLVLRADITGAESFAELLAQVRDTTLDAFEHRDLPFELLVRELSPRRAPGIMPLINVVFAFSSRGGGRPAGPAAAGVVVREVDTGGARVDLTLGIEDDAGELRGAAEYDLGLFRRGTIEQLCGGLLRVIEAAVAEPDVPVWRIGREPEARPP